MNELERANVLGLFKLLAQIDARRAAQPAQEAKR